MMTLAAGAANNTGLLFGLMLLAAFVGGFSARVIRVPAVVGFLLAGAVLRMVLEQFWVDGPAHRVSGIETALEPLKAIKSLGLGLILFSIGSVFEVGHIRSVGRRVGRIVLWESGLTLVLVTLGVFAAVSLTTDLPLGFSIALALLLGTAAMETAPAATLFVLRKYDSKGPITDTILSVTGANNILTIVLFTITFLTLAATGMLGETSLSGSGIGLSFVLMTVGSVGIGVLLGIVLSAAHARLPTPDTILLILASLLALGMCEQLLLVEYGVSFSYALVALSVGAVFSNVAIDPDRLDSSLRIAGRPILVGFFVIAGFSINPGDLLKIGVIGIAYAVCRSVGKVLGTVIAVRQLGDPPELRRSLGAGLVCQAAIILGWVQFVKSHWNEPAAAELFQNVALGSAILFESIGPLLTKSVVVRSGEVKLITLMRRVASPTTDDAAAERGSTRIFSLTIQSLLRSIGFGRSAQETGPLQIRHVMRTNVKCIPAAARFDEVLGLVAQSRYNHFPVVDENDDLIGIIHFADIRGILYNPSLGDLVTAADLASTDTMAVGADQPLASVLEAFQRNEIGSLPVVEREGSKRVVGLIEQRDAIAAVRLGQKA